MKKGFTLIEAVLIIVIVGILAAVAIPRLERNSLIEAADQVASHIRYTQQLAMSDNKFSAADNRWFQRVWRIQFHQAQSPIGEAGDTRYTVFWDNGGGAALAGQANGFVEVATDPQNPSKSLSSGIAGLAATNNANAARLNPKMDLTNEYDIQAVNFGPTCRGNNGRNRTIAFDSKGRPLTQVAGNAMYANLLRQPCTITLTNSAGNSAVITILPETGYVSYQLAGDAQATAQ